MQSQTPLFIIPKVNILDPVALDLVVWTSEDVMLGTVVVASPADQLHHLPVALEHDAVVLALVLTVVGQQVLEAGLQASAHGSRFLQAVLHLQDLVQGQSLAKVHSALRPDLDGSLWVRGGVGEQQLSARNLKLHVDHAYFACAHHLMCPLHAAVKVIAAAMASEVGLGDAGTGKPGARLNSLEELRTRRALPHRVVEARGACGEPDQLPLSLHQQGDVPALGGRHGVQQPSDVLQVGLELRVQQTLLTQLHLGGQEAVQVEDRDGELLPVKT